LIITQVTPAENRGLAGQKLMHHLVSADRSVAC